MYVKFEIIVEYVTLERGSTTSNFSYLEYLITSFHSGFPKNIPRRDLRRDVTDSS